MRSVIGVSVLWAFLLVAVSGQSGALTAEDHEEIRNLYARYSHAYDAGNGQVDLTNGGTYEDMLVKTGEGWRFKSRTFTPFGSAGPGGGQ